MSGIRKHELKHNRENSGSKRLLTRQSLPVGPRPLHTLVAAVQLSFKCPLAFSVGRSHKHAEQTHRGRTHKWQIKMPLAPMNLFLSEPCLYRHIILRVNSSLQLHCHSWCSILAMLALWKTFQNLHALMKTDCCLFRHQ